MIFRNSVIIGAFGVASILLGIFRDRLLAQYVGIGDALDIYNAAFRLPDLVLGITVSFAASATVIPFISKAIATNNNKDLQQRMSTLFIFFGCSTTLLSLLVIAIVPYMAPYLVPGFSFPKQAEYIHYTRILMLQPVLLGLSTLISTLAQARHQFYLYGLAPLVYTLGTILGIIFFYKEYGVKGLVAGVLLGAFLHLSVQSYTLYKHSIPITLNSFKWHLIREHLEVSVPRSGSFIITQVRLLFFASFATTFGVGAVSIYLFAQKIFDAVIQVLPQSIGTASLPSLSKYASSGEGHAYKKVFKKQAIVLAILSVIIAIGMAVFSEVIVKILYGETGYNTQIATFVSILSLALPLAIINAYISVAFSALKDTKTLFIANAIATVVAIASIVLLSLDGHGLQSIAQGTIVLTVVYTLVISYVYIKKRHVLFQ